MIIKCIKCETSFHFEDQLMAGEGVWVRCGRCAQVFFQDNPDYEEEDRLPSRVEEIRGLVGAAAEDAALISKEFDDLEALTVEESASELGGEPSKAVARGQATKIAAVGRFFAYLFLAFSLGSLLAGAYLWAFPEARQQAGNFLALYFPLPEDFTKGQKTTDPAIGQVLLQDVRQHFTNNWLLGNLWVVEGAAVNTGRYALTRVQVQGRLYDNGGNILTERLSFCGNLLTDAELSSMTEEDIMQRLTQPPDSSLSLSRLSPGGQLPFMIVLAHDQPAVAKTTVKVAGAEKLLE